MYIVFVRNRGYVCVVQNIDLIKVHNLFGFD